VSEELRAVLDFVEGRSGSRQFEAFFYSHLGRFESFFRYDPDRPQLQKDLYLSLVTLDYGDPYSVVDAQELLTSYLTRNGISFRGTREHEDLAEILRTSQPDWLDVDAVWLQKEVLPEAGSRTGDELRQWLTRRFQEMFLFVKTPPQWLQHPEWPIGPNGPLLYLGMVDTENYLGHGEIAYLFYDVHSGDTETVIQIVE
jgi:hypothetical protein